LVVDLNRPGTLELRRRLLATISRAMNARIGAIVACRRREMNMLVRSGWPALGAIAIFAAVASGTAAKAQDFFSTLFGGWRQPTPATTPMPYASEGSTGVPRGEVFRRHRRLYSDSEGLQAYCVRACDGRYFPITSSGDQTKAATCSGFCPAAETRVVYGSNIDSAVTETGKPYSELPNAYRYRDELVAGCSCNGKDPTGLASIKIEDDPTLRKGDIVAGSGGLMIAGRGADRRGAALNFSPAPKSVRAHYRRVPVVAAQ
jgi:Protein of unknown function (DUF2865)